MTARDPHPVLHHEFVTAPDSDPGRWLYILHGVFGSGRNWATVARRLVRARPEWGAVLVDLRAHGSSQGFTPPHTLEACAADLTALANATGREVAALMGHSFGGKVAMTYVLDGGRPAQLWVVDSTPESNPAGESASAMLERLRDLPGPFESRDALIVRLRAAGLSLPVAQWMATNLSGDAESGYRWRFDLDAIEELMADFARQELWGLLSAPPEGTEVHLIKAEESGLLAGEALARVERLADGQRVHLHHVSGGHWVNAENPGALHELLAGSLPPR